MRRTDIEAWTLRIVDLVRAGQQVEDDRVELKAIWPEPTKAARRMAACSNALRGEPGLWIIGIDEKAKTIPGADTAGVENWWPAVEAEFDRVWPDASTVLVPTEDTSVVAIYLATDRAPFVVRNPAFGTTRGDGAEYEVPWRDGMRTRSARREELLRLLLPPFQPPAIDVLSATLGVRSAGVRDGALRDPLSWDVDVRLYVTPAGTDALVIPFHRCSLEFIVDGRALLEESSSLKLAPYGHHQTAMSAGISASAWELTVTAPGMVRVSANPQTPHVELPWSADAEVRVHLFAVGADRAADVVVPLRMAPGPLDGGTIARWMLKS